MKEDKIIEPFFSHDIGSRQDNSIIRLLIKLGWEGYGLFWAIVEHMHKNPFAVEDESLIAYELRVDEEKIHQIMNDFGLFRVEEGFYISDRILRNLNYVEQKNEDKKQAANVRWLLSSFNKAYVEFFNEEPILSTQEVESLKKYNDKIPELRNKMRDIIYTLKCIKFDTDINFKPCANWLLKDNNLGRLLNGEFGPVKHKKTEKELREEQRKQREAEQKRNEPSEFEIRMQNIQSREDAMAFIFDHYKDKTLLFARNKAMIVPTFRPIMERYGIVDDDLRSLERKESSEGVL